MKPRTDLLTDENKARVEMGAACGMPISGIAKEVGCAKDTLRKYFSEELSHGKQKMLAKVAKTIFQGAIGDPDEGIRPNYPACMFILKTQAGWKETSKHELTGPDGDPISVREKPSNQIDFSKLSPGARREILEQMEAQKANDEAGEPR